MLGVGCQKGGTTWLHAYLNGFLETDFGFDKEYHVFDAVYMQNLCGVFYEHKLERLVTLINDGSLKHEDKHLLKHIDFYRDTTNYFEFFNYLYNKAPHTRVVGDITPSYCGLPVDAFQQIKFQAEQVGFNMKVIFLMRDPVERIWSQVRMGRREEQKNSPEYVNPRTIEEELLFFFVDEQCKFRTQYDKTIKNLESSFPPSDIHCEFYENLFNENAIKNITDFLDLPFIQPNFAAEHNTTEKTDTLSEETIRLVANHYRDTYQFCYERYGKDKINALWPSSIYV